MLYGNGWFGESELCRRHADAPPVATLPASAPWQCSGSPAGAARRCDGGGSLRCCRGCVRRAGVLEGNYALVVIHLATAALGPGLWDVKVLPWDLPAPWEPLSSERQGPSGVGWGGQGQAAAAEAAARARSHRPALEQRVCGQRSLFVVRGQATRRRVGVVPACPVNCAALRYAMLSGVAVMAAWSAVGQLYRVLVFPTANLVGKVRPSPPRPPPRPCCTPRARLASVCQRAAEQASGAGSWGLSPSAGPRRPPATPCSPELGLC